MYPLFLSSRQFAAEIVFARTGDADVLHRAAGLCWCPFGVALRSMLLPGSSLSSSASGILLMTWRSFLFPFSV